MKFLVNKKGCKEPGYVKVNHLRQFWSSSTDFDEYLTNLFELRLGKDEKLSHQIWLKFQHKFTMTHGKWISIY